MGFLDSFKDNKFLSEIKDPFRSDKVDEVTLRIYPRGFWGNGKPEFKALIHFKNGSTGGHQNVEAPDFTTLCQKVQAEIQNLDKK